MDRRRFLSRTVFFTVAPAVLTACGGGSDDDGPAEGSHLFGAGVASGDVRADSAVFWTRCTAASGDARQEIGLRLQVAADARFEGTLLAEVPLTATATYDHTVRAKVTGLPARSRLHYRFVAGRDVSTVGTLRTAAPAGAVVDQLRFAWFTCQDWSVNHWAAMDLLAAEDLDFVVHVGDYVYETVGAAFQAGAAEAAHGAIRFPDGTDLPDGSRYATTLEDYRTLYRTYRSDPRLQAVHARFALIATWDDHEFSDDCWQDHQTYSNANLQQTARRRAASQAWLEYMPIDFGDVAFDPASPSYQNLRIYRDFQFGSLAHLVMTDERLYRDDHVVPEAVVAEAQGHDPINGSDSIGARYFVQQDVLQQFEAVRTAALGRPPSILGTSQTEWWKQTLGASTATWKLWGNETMLSRLWIDLRGRAPAPYDALYVVNCDGWDGYPRHRAELLTHLRTRGITNVVALTGDLHAFQCGVVRDQPDPATGTPVLVDLVCAGISSSSFYSYVKAGAGSTPLAALVSSPEGFDAALRLNNPDLRYADHDAQGFASATLTADALTVVFTKVRGLGADGRAPTDPILRRTRITVAAGTVEPRIEESI